jgi:hypothetical protein
MGILWRVMGGSLKAEGLGDGCAGAFRHPQAALEAATRIAMPDGESLARE